ncbi:MAG TPA: MarR family transcriptional regulator [Mycobacteriales bacterium]|nr:MarR family transcriptional regulator [Mycobacteriales bacterium]
MPKSTTRADTELSGALRIGVMRLARRLRAERTDASLSLTQMAALGSLERHGPLSPSELAGHERVRPPSMTRTIALLEAKGLVGRTAHPTDGRQAIVALSAEGRALLAADRRRRDAWLSRRLPELEPDELEVLRAAVPILDRLAQS